MHPDLVKLLDLQLKDLALLEVDGRLAAVAEDVVLFWTESDSPTSPAF